MMPQEQDHGGRIFFEYWDGDQTQNYIGSSRASSAANTDKEIKTQWYNVGLNTMFNRTGASWSGAVTANRSLTTETDAHFRARSTFNSSSFGDIEVMGVYTGFFSDMSTGLEVRTQTSDGHLHRPWTRS